MINFARELSVDPDHVAVLDCAKYHGKVLEIENLPNVLTEILKDPQENRASTIIKTSARLSWISDKTNLFAAGRDIFSFNYFAIIAESSAKLCFNYNGKGKSKFYCNRFFNELLPNKTSNYLIDEFIIDTAIGKNISNQKLADLIYSLRCDLAHEGKYYHFYLKDNESQVPLAGTYRDEMFTIRLTLNELKKVILLGALNAAALSLNSQDLKISLKTFLD
jgi:hypothetical protein